MIHFTLDLKPQPKQRARVTKKGRAYTPSATREFELNVRTLAGEHISEPLRGALSLEVLFVYPRLKSEPKRHSGRKYKTTRPDLSNLIKSLEDGLEGVAFSDDAQISRIVSEKIHGAINETAHIEVTLQEIDQYINTQNPHNVGGETRARTSEDDVLNQLNQLHAQAEERALTRRERSIINRREHRIKQDAKHERMSRERSSKKLENTRIKLQATSEKRKREAQEKARLARERREREHQEFIERYLPRRRRHNEVEESSDENSSSGSPNQVSPKKIEGDDDE